jgi:hypothetical protein
MGGYGSGRYGGRPTVESALRLDIDDMMQWGGIRAFAQAPAWPYQLRCRDEDAAIRFQDQSVTLDLHMEEIRMSSQVPKLAAAGSFGIALLGLYLIFNSTGTPLSLAACTMFIVGTVVGVMLMQSGE